MKRKSSILISALILWSTLSQPISQATTAKTNGPAIAANNVPLPDLIVGNLNVADLKIGKVTITIENYDTWGNPPYPPAGASYVVFKLTHYKSKGDTRPTEMSYHAKVPALCGGCKATVEIETKLDVTWDKACIIADATNQVRESNEANNKWCGLVTDIFPSHPVQ